MTDTTPKENGIKATSLRGLLISLLLVIIVGASVGFYFANDFLSEMAHTIKKENPTISSNDSTMKATSLLKDFVIKNKSISDKASLITVSATNAQNLIMSDLKKYASDAGIKISELSFNTTQSTVVGGTSTTQQVNITIENPVVYSNLVKFLQLVESSLPLMQPAGISISTVDKTKVKVDPITIKFFTK